MVRLNKYISVSLPSEIISEIEKRRGDISRSRYILRCIESGLESMEKSKKK